MKALAGGLLAFAAVVYVVTLHQTGFLGYVNAGAEASMVGAVADWFAVTALFKHPLGLPIPHTAIIPTRKDALGRSLQEFVTTNFLAEDVVRGRLERADVARRVGVWLSDPGHATRVAAELSSLARGAMTVMQDEQVVTVLESIVLRRARLRPWGPPAGRLLDRVISDGAHHRLVDVAADSLYDWLVEHEDVVVRLVTERAPVWTPSWVDLRVAKRAHLEAVNLVRDTRDDRDHRVRKAIDGMLTQLARDLQVDPETMARADAFRDGLLDHPDVRSAVAALWKTVRAVLEEAIDDPGSELRVRTLDGLISLGQRLATDEQLQRVIDRYITDAVGHLISGYADEVATVISETVDRWDGDDASRRIELHVGHDLQFIRINGTVVGGLVGLLIHTVALLAG
ncbi:MAG TPA: DUF445 domain-containing protein, partial [Kineosporiaceae bacterium]|nr:DUF445 domain-containing protein [Kineosporiaceae bacterium]